ncbi:MAG: hypothetical protein JWM90_2769 [Thermoleophilia bacterium]|nr:hypothetical protein [Thermoleophilia bacterium]
MTDEVRAQLGDTIAGAFGYTFWWALGLLALAVVPALLLPRRPVEADDHLVDEHGNDSGQTVAPPVIMH